MLWDDSIDNYKKNTKDSSTENETLGKARMNQYYQILCASRDFYWLEGKWTDSTVANQQEYFRPVRARKLTAIEIKVGDRQYDLDEVVNPKVFNQLNFDRTTYRSDYPTKFHIRNDKYFVWPTPSSSGNVITLIGLKRPIPLSQSNYSGGGTISVTNGDATVTGSGTTFTTMKVRDRLVAVINGVTYNIASITNDTALELERVYEGATESGITTSNYKIGETFLIPEEYQDLPWLLASRAYYSNKKENGKMYQLLDAMVKEMEGRLISETGTRASIGVYNRARGGLKSINYYPENIG